MLSHSDTLSWFRVICFIVGVPVLLHYVHQWMATQTMCQWVIVVYAKLWQFFSYIMLRTSYVRWDDDNVPFLIDNHTKLDFYSASSLKQQSVGRHVAPFGHIILILSQPIFVITPQCCMFIGAATNTYFIIFGLTHLNTEKLINRI